MRMILMTGMMSMLASAASAESSIDVITKDDAPHSIDFIKCTHCAPLKSKKADVPNITLKSGTQRIELKTVNGVLKVFRTEAWMGGSPVTYVSKASTDLMDRQTAEAVPAAEQEIQPLAIDKDTARTASAETGAEATVTIDKDTTSSTTADMSGDPAPAAEPKTAQAFDPQTFQLRLN